MWVLLWVKGRKQADAETSGRVQSGRDHQARPGHVREEPGAAAKRAGGQKGNRIGVAKTTELRRSQRCSRKGKPSTVPGLEKFRVRGHGYSSQGTLYLVGPRDAGRAWWPQHER